MAGFQLSINGRFWVSTEAKDSLSVQGGGADGSGGPAAALLRLLLEETRTFVAAVDERHEPIGLRELESHWARQLELVKEISKMPSEATGAASPGDPSGARGKPRLGPALDELVLAEVAELAGVARVLVSRDSRLSEDLGLGSLQRMELATRLVKLAGRQAEVFDSLIASASVAQLLDSLTHKTS